jgi:outer membrane protein assembly factor BamE (lipoprotein component of BamABCDE complex)
MKAIAFFSLLIGAILVSSVSAFAMEQNIQPIQQWVGKPATQVVKALGEPSYTSTTKHGRLIYDFVQEPQHVGSIGTYQFVIGQNGKVVSANLAL